MLELNNELQRRGKHGVVRWVDRMDGPHHSPAWTSRVYSEHSVPPTVPRSRPSDRPRPAAVEEVEYAMGYGATKQAARDAAARVALAAYIALEA